MKKKILFLVWLLVLLCAGTSAFSQNQKVIFPTPAGVDNSSGMTVRPTADGGYILTGDAQWSDNSQGYYNQPRVVKVDAALQAEWDNHYLQNALPWASISSISAGFEHPDGTFSVAVQDDSSFVDLLRIGADGALLQMLELPQFTSGLQVFDLMPDGNLLGVRSFNDGSWKTGIVHIDASGAVVYSKAVSNGFSFDVLLLQNDDLLFRSYNYQTQKYTLTRTDKLGNQLWQSAPTPGLSGLMTALPDGGFGITGGTSAAFTVRLFNTQGSQTGTTTPIAIQGSVQSLAAYPDGSFLAGGTAVTNRAFLLHFAADGSTNWLAVSPEDNQPPQYAVNGLPTTDGWAIGVSDGSYYVNNANHFGLFRVQDNTGLIVNTISGRVARDNDESCTVDAAEPAVGQTLVKAQNQAGETWSSFCDNNGNYQILVPDGDYTLSVQSYYPFFFLCPDAPVAASFAPGVSGSATVDLPIESQELVHHISGTLTLDENDNCTAESGEPPLSAWYISLVVNNSQFIPLSTDNNGHYSVFVPNGDYQVQAYPFNLNFGICGSNVANITFNSTTPESAVADFTAFPKLECAQMHAAVYMSAIRPCTTATVHAAYSNYGTIPAEDATFKVTLDPSMTYSGASLTPSLVDGQDIWFNLGDVPPSFSWDYHNINIYVTTDCDLPLGNQVCVSTQVTPNTYCGPAWDGAVTAVEGECQGDSAFFIIRNIGNAPNSQMLDFVIVEDQIVLKSGQFQLPPGGIQVEGVLPMGTDTAVTIIADQEPGFPGDPQVTFSLANCVSGSTLPGGYGGNPGPFSAQACATVSGPFDPNNKQAFPIGSGPEHVVQPGTPLLYVIRFQNTGTDTAFQVVLRDTLSAYLDPSTIKVEDASHPFEMFLLGDLLQFRFDNIQLPDSSTNMDASQGYISFLIYPRPDLSLGTVVTNRAAIYFDFNEPIITNTVSRKYDQLYSLSTDAPASGAWLPVRIYPNPFADFTTLELPDTAPSGTYSFELFDMGGRTLKNLSFNSSSLLIQREDIPAGIMGWRLVREGQIVASGKLSVVGNE